MGKDARSGEPAAQEVEFRKLGLPILGAVSGGGSIEGGDVVWVDERTVAVGRGYRTNDEGIRQLREFLGDSIDELIAVPLPHWRGPEDVFHLMSILSPIDHDLSLVYSPLMPVPFREALLARGIELVEVPDAEFVTMGINVLAVAPRVCVMLAGNPETKIRLESHGAQVFEFEGGEICRKGAGGPTCLTRPLERGR
jgi:N-dimethylarginine dimethylaminohydrolase